MIGTAKRCLRKVLRKAKLNADELLTVLTKLEVTINSCPLTYKYDEVGAEMLTPSYMIYRCWLTSLPEETRNDEEERKTGYLRRFRYLAKLRIHVWNHWHKEYLIDLREHHRHKGESNHKVSKGEVVLVHEDNVQRSNWKMGKVKELIVGKDREVVGVKLRLLTKGKPILFNTPLQKVYPLEVHGISEESSRVWVGVVSGGSANEQPVGTKRPACAAALDLRWLT